MAEILFISLFVFMVLGLPVAFAMAISVFIAIELGSSYPPIVVVKEMFSGLDSFPLLAVPFFILAAEIMTGGAITQTLLRFASQFVGHLRGGLGYANVISSTMFAGISGSALADAAGPGAMMIRMMEKGGYDRSYAGALTISSAVVGPIIPPSLPMVIYGVVAGTSIGQLFVAGFIPGLLMAVALMVMIAIMARTRGFGRDQAFYWPVLFSTFRRAFLSLLTPVIIVGGILSGAFTPTEAAVAACAWALFLGVVVYRTLTIRRFLRVSFDTIETTAVVLLVVGAAAIFAWILTSNRVPEQFAAGLLAVSDKPWVILIVMNLLAVGCFMETVAAITILVPVMLPIAVTLGIDPVHFGVIMVLNLMLGLLTPPVGMVLYVLARVAKIPFEQCVVGTAPFLIPLVIVLLLVTFIPGITMWLPTMIYR